MTSASRAHVDGALCYARGLPTPIGCAEFKESVVCILGSCPEEHLAFVSGHKRLCTAAVLAGNWRTTCIASLSSPQVANHKSSLSLVDLSIMCG